MKKTNILLALAVLTASAAAQQNIHIKQNTRFQYSISVEGRSFPMYFQLDSLNAANMVLSWGFDDGRSGRFIAGRASIDSAVKGYYNPPEAYETVAIPATQCLLFFPKLLFASLLKNKTVLFDDAALTLKPYTAGNVFKVMGKIIDALYLESGTGTRIWILNNPETPLVLKIENNPAGVDVELVWAG
jgi:hypothetical protein